MQDLNDFLTSRPFSTYSRGNPETAREITEFLTKFLTQNKSLPGIEIVYKRLADAVKSEKSPPLKWFNIFSQIRCTSFLIARGITVKAVEVPAHSKTLDFELAGQKLGEIKSFSTIDERLTDPNAIDEYVIKTFTEKKVIPAFEDQNADLLIIDDIFSHYSEQYGLLDYFLSFINNPEILDRHQLIQQHLGKYLSKILYLSFVESITENPRVKFKGKEFVEIGI